MNMSALSHLPVLSSAGEMDNVYELESSGTCAVALYDYQGGGSAIRLWHWELAGVERQRGGSLISSEEVLTGWFTFLPPGKQNET